MNASGQLQFSLLFGRWRHMLGQSISSVSGRLLVAIVSILTGGAVILYLTLHPGEVRLAPLLTLLLSVSVLFCLALEGAWRSWLRTRSPKWPFVLTIVFLTLLTASVLFVFVTIAIKLSTA